MDDQDKSYFTIEEVNTLLPLMRRRLESAARRRAEIARLEQELEPLVRQRQVNGTQSMDLEVAGKRGVLAQTNNRLDFVLESITQRDIVVRDPVKGHLDFPYVKEGREVCLCWVMGESRMMFWHETHADLDDRKPL